MQKGEKAAEKVHTHTHTHIEKIDVGRKRRVERRKGEKDVKRREKCRKERKAEKRRQRGRIE